MDIADVGRAHTGAEASGGATSRSTTSQMAKDDDLQLSLIWQSVRDLGAMAVVT
jgi:hypothetical protein